MLDSKIKSHLRRWPDMLGAWKFIFLITGLFSIQCYTYSQASSDNGNGTYSNPVIAADFPDPDVISVGDTYYMVSTTMFVFPGVTILKSKDLVNWQYCSNTIPRFDISNCYNLDGCNEYGHGQWATSIKYHDGKFFLLFMTLKEGGFIGTADHAEGPWHIKHLSRGYYDPGLFFDSNGRIFIAHGNGKIYLTEVDTDFAQVSKDSLVFTGDLKQGLEGTHMYKINGYYYLYSTYGGVSGIQVALRSKNIYGPYEQRVVIRDTSKGVNFGIHQGALIETQTGEWWTILFVDSGPFGRFPSLQPVSWNDHWPVAGQHGKGVITYKKPNVGGHYPITVLPSGDEFNSDTLGMQWGWNHNPDAARWSLTERRGFLRLTTVRVVSKFTDAVNTLTQRPFADRNRQKPSIAETRLDMSHMKDGDVAGLAVFQEPYAFIAVKKHQSRYFVVMVNNGIAVDSALVGQSDVFLRTEASNVSRQATFAYSLDNKHFIPLGDTLTMQFSLKVFTGNKFCLFNYPTIKSGGYVDFDWFRCRLQHS